MNLIKFFLRFIGGVLIVLAAIQLVQAIYTVLGGHS
jgi:hypothetical protein